METEETPQENPQETPVESTPTVQMTAVIKDGNDTVPNTPMYMSKDKLIRQYWITKKMEQISSGMSTTEFDATLKPQYIAEAEALYPKKGMYRVTEIGAEYLGNI